MAKVLSSSKVLDDRGREFPTVRIAETQVWDGRDEAAELPTELEIACAGAVSEFAAAGTQGLSNTVSVMWAGLWMGFFVLSFAPRDLTSLVLIICICGGTLIGWEIYRRSGSRRACDERLLATLLAAARCPSCGYDLEPARAPAGECTCCPECGAAWGLPPRSHLPLRMPGVPDQIVPEAEHPTKDRVSYADGRGRAVWLVDAALRVMPNEWHSLPEAKKARIADRLADRLSFERAMYVFGGLGVVVFGGALYAAGSWGSIASVIISLVLLVFSLGLLWLALTSKRAGDSQAIAQIFLNSWVCPSCATHFENLQEEPDGCITCPACRAAWRVKGALAESPGLV